MSVCRPASCLFRRNAAPMFTKSSSLRPTRPLHSTAIRPGRRRPHYPSVPQAELEKLNENARRRFPEYTEEERKALKYHYTPQQLAALEEAEKAIDVRDLATQGVFRVDPWVPAYLDDFTTFDPFLDKKQTKEPTQAAKFGVYTGADVGNTGGDGDPRTTDDMFIKVERRNLSEQERTFFSNLKRFKGTNKEPGIRKLLANFVGPPQPEDYRELLTDPISEIKGSRELIEQGLDEDYSVLAPEVPKMEDPRIRWPYGEDDDPNAAGLRRLSLQTGFTLEEIKKFRVKRLVMHRVVNQTRMGKIASQYTLTIAGNEKGLLGIGEGKSSEPEDSTRQAMVNAIRNMKPIHRYEDRTIYGTVKGKVGAVEVELSSRPPGFGIRCHHLMFEICRCVGINDLSARSIRSRNMMNTVKATVAALTSQKLPEDIARARGRKLVDVRKVYYAGKVY